MVIRYTITAGAGTTAGGNVMSGSSARRINGAAVACAGDPVSCPTCNSTGVIEPDGPRLGHRFNAKLMALSDDVCRCKCTIPPRLVANQTFSRQIIDADWAPAG
ncbi:MAG: PAAR domain-containing protein [Massilia sp.]